MIENYQVNRFCEPLRDCFFSESSIFILPSCPFNRNVIHKLKRLQSINFYSFVFLDWLWKQGDKEICTWFASVKMVQKVLLRTLVHLIAWEFLFCFVCALQSYREMTQNTCKANIYIQTSKNLYNTAISK